MMKVKNKRFFRQELFIDRVQTALKHWKMDYDTNYFLDARKTFNM